MYAAALSPSDAQASTEHANMRAACFPALYYALRLRPIETRIYPKMLFIETCCWLKRVSNNGSIILTNELSAQRVRALDVGYIKSSFPVQNHLYSTY